MTPPSNSPQQTKEVQRVLQIARARIAVDEFCASEQEALEELQVLTAYIDAMESERDRLSFSNESLQTELDGYKVALEKAKNLIKRSGDEISAGSRDLNLICDLAEFERNGFPSTSLNSLKRKIEKKVINELAQEIFDAYEIPNGYTKQSLISWLCRRAAALEDKDRPQ